MTIVSTSTLLGPRREIIALAVEHPGHDLLLDEADGRQRAQVYDISLTGTVGLIGPEPPSMATSTISSQL